MVTGLFHPCMDDLFFVAEIKYNKISAALHSPALLLRHMQKLHTMVQPKFRSTAEITSDENKTQICIENSNNCKQF